MADKFYLSDEQLLALIEDVEENNLIMAPKHLKGNVLSEIRKRSHRAKVINIATYRMKVAAACAVSILLFGVLPFGMPSTIERVEGKMRIKDMTNDKINVIEEYIEAGRNEGDCVKDKIAQFIDETFPGTK